ncbi:MAG: TonB-dependent receptor [Gammaproteobacteria bacterium]|nr:TonB-dependent receptor [Rhodocyclaceae bacterium]MBU3909376.1 TonB-dependent receptor [Gammaproteobacteria bacterium]MBU3990197.1 TonB-dependent receptor [Gammaproteobacteria bacterium]MBU4005464.1 TonB-dependent receptor [Gammaproteobacteria bacterium]MBU4020983.1 TonB-dependent receptor [Gammaproteobacteria bacterium]
MKKRTFAILFAGLFQAQAAHADTAEEVAQLLSISLEELMATKVTISTNTLQALSRAPSAVSVITAEDIKATGARNLAEILQSVPGVYIRANLFGFRPQITFRGATSQNTLLMVDGAPVKDLVWNAGIFWRGLSTTMIDRVEIIRGPGSALFGSDASAGVINVITKTARGIDNSEAGVRADSFDTQTAWVQHGGIWNGFAIGFTAEASTTAGHRPFFAADGQTARDPSISYAPGYAGYGLDSEDFRFYMAKGNWRLQADYLRRRNIETGLTGAATLDPLTRGSDNRYNLALFYGNQAFAKDWGLNAELRYQHLDYTSGDGFLERPPGFVCVNSVRDCNGGTPGLYPVGLLNQMRSAERRWNFEVSGLYSGVKNHAIRLGGGYVAQDLYSVEHFVNYGKVSDTVTLPAGGPLVDISGSNYAFAPEKVRRTNYLFLQDVWSFADNWELTAGARYDHYSDFGGALNPRVALVWQSTDRLTTKLMYGEAFRAPSYLELYARTAATQPNDKLMPERSKTWDLSISYLVTRDFRLGLDLYQFAQSDLIAQDSSGQYQNMGSNTSRGVELEAQWVATQTLRFSGNLTDREDSTPNNAVPKQTAYLRADWVFMPRWNWNVQANWIGKHALAPGDPRAPIGAYTLVDTTVRYSPRREWEFAASIRNLFDVDARELSSRSLVNNLPLPMRSVFAEVRYKF